MSCEIARPNRMGNGVDAKSRQRSVAIRVRCGDVVAVLTTLFGSEPFQTDCLDACDANNDGLFDIADPITTLSALFAGVPLPAPHPDCEVDFDGLGCESYGVCP
ncbi:MAG: hypothetical protein AAF581_08875 [Planctomycetota bacterium]